MRRRLRTIRAYLDLSRVSNLPTCWTNVLVGCGLGLAAFGEPIGTYPWITAGLVGVAISLMYVGGMALNDACDAKTDTCERPTRPIPSGRASCRGAYVYAGWCLGLGLGVLTFAGTPAAVTGGVLAACIILYNVLHQRIASSVVLLGLCRGLVYLVAAVSVVWPTDWTALGTMAGAMCWYVIILSIVARRETEAGRTTWGRLLTLSMFLTLLVPALVMKVSSPMFHPIEASEWWGVGLGVAAAVWIVWSARHILAAKPVTKQAVLGWLAGICLVDAFFLALLAPWLGMDWASLMAVALACFVLTLAGHRLILGT